MLDARYPAAIFANGIGDHLLSLPATRALAAIFAGRLSLICMDGTRHNFFSDLPLRMACETEMHCGRYGWEFDADAVAEKVGECDLLVSLNPWHSVSVSRLLKRLHPPRSLGFFPEFKVALSRDFTKHSADLAFGIPQYLDRTLVLEDFAQPPVFGDSCKPLFQELRRNIPPSMSLLALHTETKVEKMWPRRRFVKLLDMFLDRHPEFMVLVLDRENTQLDVGRRRDHIVPCSQLNVLDAISLVGKSDLFLGVDSCLLHAADLFCVPGVGLFGPTSCKEWGFRLANHRHVCADRAMSGIRIEDVMDALESLLATGVKGWKR